MHLKKSSAISQLSAVATAIYSLTFSSSPPIAHTFCSLIMILLHGAVFVYNVVHDTAFYDLGCCTFSKCLGSLFQPAWI